jgi:hypothetical protein
MKYLKLYKFCINLNKVVNNRYNRVKIRLKKSKIKLVSKKKNNLDPDLHL